MQEISALHQAAQVAVIVSIAAVVIVAIWQFFKTIREN